MHQFVVSTFTMAETDLDSEPMKPRKRSISLSISLWIGKLIGCVPVGPRPPRASKRSCTWNWQHFFSVVYVILALLVQLVILALIMMFDVPFNFVPPATISEGIVASTTEMVLSCSEVVKRVYYLARHRLVYEAMDRILALEGRVKDRGFCKGTGSLIDYRVYALYLLVFASVVLQLFQLEFEDVTNADLITATIHFTEILWKISHVFSTVLLFGLGQKLITCYGGVAAEFLAGFGEDRAKTVWVASAWGPSNLVLVDLFQEMQGCFGLYNKVVGFILFVSVFESVILSLVCIYLSINYWSDYTWFDIGDMLICGLIYGLRVVLIACTGQAAFDLMAGTKEKIRSRMLRMEVGLGTSKSTDWILGNHILAWNWHLSACNLFDISYRLFSLVLGSGMTYIMFIFQLRIAEEMNGLGSHKP